MNITDVVTLLSVLGYTHVHVLHEGAWGRLEPLPDYGAGTLGSVGPGQMALESDPDLDVARVLEDGRAVVVAYRTPEDRLPGSASDPDAERSHVVDLPARFYDDHVGRGLAGGVEVKRLARDVRARLNDYEVVDLLADARFHLDMSRMGAYEADMRGLVASAKATVRRLGPIANVRA